MAIFNRVPRRIAEYRKKRRMLIENQVAGWEAEVQSLDNAIARLKNKKSEWWIDYRDNSGRRRVEKAGDGRSKRYAEMLERDRRTSVAKQEDYGAACNGLTVNEVMDIYWEEKLGDKRALNSNRQLRDYIKADLGMHKSSHLDRNPKVLIDHFRSLRKRPLKYKAGTWSQKYIHNYLICIRAAFNYVIKTKRLRMMNPLSCIEHSPGTRRRERIISQDEHERLCKHAPACLVPLLIAGWETGLRINELCAWQWEDLQFLPVKLGGKLVERPFIKTRILKQKRDRTIFIPVSKPLKEALDAIPGEKVAGTVFKRAGSHPLLKDYAETQFRVTREAAGVNDVIFHDYRRTRKTRWHRAGHDIHLTKEAVGHATLQMDEYYDCVQQGELYRLVADSWESGIQEGIQMENGCRDDEAA